MDFEQQYRMTPPWLKQKLTRRHVLKSAAGAAALASIPAYANISSTFSVNFESDLAKTPWKTLDAVLSHLLPSSESGPGAKEINATLYLYLLVHQQPTDQQEIDFIYKGVGWLNGYTEKRHDKPFEQLNVDDKESTLRAISQSRAGENWLNMLIANIYEAMLSPPAYGGNPNGIGWQWLEHKAGFPLPKTGERYFELPARSNVKTSEKIALKFIESKATIKKVTKA